MHRCIVWEKFRLLLQATKTTSIFVYFEITYTHTHTHTNASAHTIRIPSLGDPPIIHAWRALCVCCDAVTILRLESRLKLSIVDNLFKTFNKQFVVCLTNLLSAGDQCVKKVLCHQLRVTVLRVSLAGEHLRIYYSGVQINRDAVTALAVAIITNYINSLLFLIN